MTAHHRFLLDPLLRHSEFLASAPARARDPASLAYPGAGGADQRANFLTDAPPGGLPTPSREGKAIAWRTV